ncbi:MAG: hypothetical protein GX771_11825 [Halomonadaceae bacterium]|nr:hypothetical protein [Halomonadaceae bacterium]
MKTESGTDTATHPEGRGSTPSPGRWAWRRLTVRWSPTRVRQLADHMKQYWPTLRLRLLAGEYHPSPVRAVEIPKPKGGTRQLSIPTVSDRLIQQALLQLLTPIFDPVFSASSYGYRPRRSAQKAVSAMKAHVTAGHRWMVDLDLKAFFDRVNHEMLLGAPC